MVQVVLSPNASTAAEHAQHAQHAEAGVRVADVASEASGAPGQPEADHGSVAHSTYASSLGDSQQGNACVKADGAFKSPR